MLIDWSEAERFLISHKWELHSRFLDILDPHLEKTLQDWQQAVEQQAQQIDDDDARNDFYEFHSDEYLEHMEFRVILMNSFFSASFALFENQLMRICQSAKRKSGSPFAVKDLGSPSPTDRAKTYLKKLGIEFPADSQGWQQITKYREIRNKILHEGANLPDEGHLSDFARAKQIVSTWGGSLNLELTRRFCDDAARDMKRFLLGVHRAYQRWLKTSK